MSFLEVKSELDASGNSLMNNSNDIWRESYSLIVGSLLIWTLAIVESDLIGGIPPLLTDGSIAITKERTSSNEVIKEVINRW